MAGSPGIVKGDLKFCAALEPGQLLEHEDGHALIKFDMAVDRPAGPVCKAAVDSAGDVPFGLRVIGQGLFESQLDRGRRPTQRGRCSRDLAENEVAVGNTGSSEIGVPFISTDAPLHRLYRAAVFPGLKLARVRDMHERLRQRIDKL